MHYSWFVTGELLLPVMSKTQEAPGELERVREFVNTLDVEAGTEEVQAVRKTLLRQSLDAPEGIVSIDDETQHTWRPFYVGRARESVSKPVERNYRCTLCADGCPDVR